MVGLGRGKQMICRKCQAICLNPRNYTYIGNVLNREYKCRCGYRFSTHEEFDCEIKGDACWVDEVGVVSDTAWESIKKAPAKPEGA